MGSLEVALDRGVHPLAALMFAKRALFNKARFANKLLARLLELKEWRGTVK